MRVWIDTNLFLDILLDRQPFVAASLRIVALAENRLIDGFMAPITINNIYYISRRERHSDEIKRFLHDMTLVMRVGILDHQTVTIANGLAMRDYEDALQYAMAMQVGADILVTRNQKDYTYRGAVEVMDPETFIERISR